MVEARNRFGEMKPFILLSIIIGLFHPVHGVEDLEAYPEAGEGMTRHVLVLPSGVEESLFKVELIVGKQVQVDTVNRFFFAGQIEDDTIEGWGFTRYLVKDLGPIVGTRMAVPPGTPMEQRFVSLGNEPFLVHYNSKLPVVVYVPEGSEVKYRIWSAGPEGLIGEVTAIPAQSIKETQSVQNEPAPWNRVTFEKRDHGPLLERQAKLDPAIADAPLVIVLMVLKQEISGQLTDSSTNFDSMEAPALVEVTVTEGAILDDDLSAIRHKVNLARNSNNQWRIVGYERGELRRSHIQQPVVGE